MSIRFDGNQLVGEQIGRGIGIFSVVLLGGGEGD
jgi:tetrahydromethanopterin S-methyltransferase subunit G